MVKIKTVVIFYLIINCLFSTAYAKLEDNPELMALIKSCADIGNYNQNDFDENELMRRFLYTYRNFEIISDIEPQVTKSDSFTMCNSDFVKDAFYKAFRLEAPTPKPHMLTELGYCENNGFYFFSGGYTKYFATDVNRIVKAIPQDDSSLYVIFSNYYQEGTSEPVFEYSSMNIGYDDMGYYVKAINMNEDFTQSDAPKELLSEPLVQNSFRGYIPIIVMLIAFLLICVVLYLFFLKG